jgi:hypothetical protein
MDHFSEPTDPENPYSAPGTSPPVPSRRFSVFSALVLAPFSSAVWRDAGLHWRGIGLGYMALLLAVTWLIIGIRYQIEFGRFLENEAPKIVNQIPKITIKDGQVSADAEQPYTIRSPDSQQPIAVIDTTGQITEIPPDVMFLLTRDALIARNNPAETRRYDLSQVESLEIDREGIEKALAIAKVLVIPIGVPFLFAFSLVWRLVLMLILGAIGMAIGSLMGSMAMAIGSGRNQGLAFPAHLRLAAIAMTPGIWLGTFTALASVPAGWYWIPIQMALAVSYLVFAVRACRPEEGDSDLGAALPPREVNW